MEYSIWRRLQWLGVVLAFLVVGAVALLFLPWPLSLLAFLLTVVLLLPVALLGVWIRLSVTERAVDDFGGTPMPGLLGVAGYDITPDEDGGRYTQSAKEIVKQLDDSGAVSKAREPPQEP